MSIYSASDAEDAEPSAFDPGALGRLAARLDESVGFGHIDILARDPLALSEVGGDDARPPVRARDAIASAVGFAMVLSFSIIAWRWRVQTQETAAAPQVMQSQHVMQIQEALRRQPAPSIPATPQSADRRARARPASPLASTEMDKRVASASTSQTGRTGEPHRTLQAPDKSGSSATMSSLALVADLPPSARGFGDANAITVGLSGLPAAVETKGQLEIVRRQQPDDLLGSRVGHERNRLVEETQDVTQTQRLASALDHF